MDQTQFAKVNFAEQLYNASGSVESNCNGITFINLGTVPCTVLSYPLLQGQSFSPPILSSELDTTNYTARFDTTIAGSQLLLVIRKYYK